MIFLFLYNTHIQDFMSTGAWGGRHFCDQKSRAQRPLGNCPHKQIKGKEAVINKEVNCLDSGLLFECLSDIIALRLSKIFCSISGQKRNQRHTSQS
jgi:hypothetical protein